MLAASAGAEYVNPVRDFKSGDFYYAILNEDAATLSLSAPYSPESYTGDIVIPRNVTHDGKEYTVTDIGIAAFADCKSVTSVTFPETIVSIQPYAFSYCTAITEIDIPNGVTEIQRQSFRYMESLEELSIPEGVTSIGEAAFYGCTALKTVTLPASVETVEYEAFQRCTSLASLDLGNVRDIARCAFIDCPAIENLTIPETVETIGELAFSADDSRLKELHWNAVAAKVTGAQRVFPRTGTATLLTIGEKVREIPADIFDHLGTFDEIVIPDNVEKIGDYAFEYCEARRLVIGKNVKTAKSPFYTMNTTVEAVYNAVACADGNLLPSSITSLTVGDGVVSLPEKAFYYLPEITELDLPESILTIGAQAFAHCAGLKSLKIPAKVTEIHDETFLNCTGLAAITFHDGITSIGDRVLSGCESIAEITFGAGVRSIGHDLGATWNPDIIVRATTPPAIFADTFVDSQYAQSKLEIPEGTTEAYRKDDNWSHFAALWNTVGIESATTNPATTTTITDLAGRPATSTARGIFIETLRHADGTVSARKIKR